MTTTIQVSKERLIRIAVDLDEHVEDEHDGCDVQELRLPSGPEPMGAACDAPDVVKQIAAGLRQRSVLELDLQRRRIRPWRASWAMLLLAVGVAAIGEHHRDDLLDRRADAQGDLIRAQARPMHTLPAAGAARSHANEVTQEDRMQAALDMLALRDHPWPELFAGLDAGVASMSMLALAHDAKSRAVDLTLLAPDDEAAWSLVQRLASDSARFSEASLVSRERLDPPAGSLTLRVRIRAVLKGAGQGATEVAS
jgi:hypothetical protein